MCMSPWGAPGLYPCNWGTKQCLRLTSTMLWAITAQAHGRFHCWFLHPLWRWWIFVKIADFGITVHFSKNHMMAKNKTGKTNLATITLNFFSGNPQNMITSRISAICNQIKSSSTWSSSDSLRWFEGTFEARRFVPALFHHAGNNARFAQMQFEVESDEGWWRGRFFYFWSWVTRLEQFYRVQRSKKDLMIECSRVGTWNRIQLHVYTPPRSLA